jgi:hypothetical protein
VAAIVNTLNLKSAGATVVLRGEATLDVIEQLTKNLSAGPADAVPRRDGDVQQTAKR